MNDYWYSNNNSNKKNPKFDLENYILERNESTWELKIIYKPKSEIQKQKNDYEYNDEWKRRCPRCWRYHL